jgi:transposase-like protein
MKRRSKNRLKNRQPTTKLIHSVVRWSLRFSISDRKIERTSTDRGVQADHTTLFRLTQAYVLEPQIYVKDSRSLAVPPICWSDKEIATAGL